MGAESCVHLVSDVHLFQNPNVSRSPSVPLTIITPSGHAPFACSEMEMCMCLKKEALLDFIQSMICTICFLVVFSDQHTVYVFHVKTKKRKGKKEELAGIPLHHRAAKLETSSEVTESFAA